MSPGLTRHLAGRRYLNHFNSLLKGSRRRLSESIDEQQKDKGINENDTKSGSENKGNNQDSSNLNHVDSSDLNVNSKPRWVAAERDARLAKYREVVKQPPKFDSSFVFQPQTDFTFRYPIFHTTIDPRIPSSSLTDSKKDWTKTLADVLKKPLVDYPETCDFLIIGGGIIGLSTAFFIQQIWGKTTSIIVVDRDYNVSIF